MSIGLTSQDQHTPRMSLYRLSISLHCWPTRRPERRPVGDRLELFDEDRPIQRIALFDQVLDGDDRRDLEFFDERLRDGLVEAAGKLRAITRYKLDQLREIGYATRIEVTVCAEPGEIDFELPPDFVRACGELELPVKISSDQLVMHDPNPGLAFSDALDVEELKPSDLF